jgi:hypothetical protein
MDHPELLPAEDIGLGQVVVVGRESGLASGSADLVYLDSHGEICLLEVKKEGTPIHGVSWRNCSTMQLRSGASR